ncbi:MAG: DUF2945 domain-containing protein [Chloroflexi bacterium AL-W]|nr:DUF2945 domain-containing protein [Chloroflexi bacterium AL-N1]NOK65616.1 DUF2945 domain-containing protein [Chloroflexi bacterium AL-N10]NOK74443.1 DUF2945 domain-containing protein [Chloroflexi bacterium AL-N5]NOK80649.1 DUF2945 domain-containing protein [Chloroflexi bacterium AL-W]NOK88701.1 DUF2945 domain-containing protein [Chloroflexi bacterium AL-N15]
MAEQFQEGDYVEWNTPQGTTRGTIRRKLTASIHIKGHYVNATEHEPQYLVESEKTGEEAAHQPEALQKVHT